MKVPKIKSQIAYAIVDKGFPIDIASYPLKDYKLTAWAIVRTKEEAKILFKKSTKKSKNAKIVEVQINYVEQYGK